MSLASNPQPFDLALIISSILEAVFSGPGSAKVTALNNKVDLHERKG